MNCREASREGGLGHVSRFALIKPPHGGGIRIEAYGLYKTASNCARRARFEVANLIGSVVPIERLFEKTMFFRQSQETAANAAVFP